MKKYFDTLGLKEDCEQELIKAAYKTLIHKYHPDKWEKNKNFAREKFIAIKNAYSILSNQKTNKEFHNKDQNKDFEFKSSKHKKNYLTILFFVLSIIILLSLFKYFKENLYLHNNENNKPLFLSNQFSKSKHKFCFKSICIDSKQIKSEIKEGDKQFIKFLYGHLDETNKVLHTFFIHKRDCFKCKDELLLIHNNFNEKYLRWSNSTLKNTVLIESKNSVFTSVEKFNQKKINLYSVDFLNKNKLEKSIFSYIFIQNQDGHYVTYIGKYLRGRIFGNSCEKLGFFSFYEPEIIDKKMYLNRIENYFFGCENNKISNSSVTKFPIEKKIYY